MKRTLKNSSFFMFCVERLGRYSANADRGYSKYNGSKYNGSKYGSTQRGAAFVELIVVVPFLAFVFFGAAEYVRVLRIFQEMSTISKELGNGAFSDCLELDDSQTCVLDLLGKINVVSQSTLPASGLIISIYKQNPTTGVVTQAAFAAIGPNSLKCSKFTATGVTPTAGCPAPTSVAAAGSVTASILSQNKALAIGELYTSYTPIFSTSPLGGLTNFYDYTIY